MIARLRNKRGFTLVELMIVVAIVGVLAALAIYGVRKYIANAKTAEARSSIGRMAKDAKNAYAGENMASAVLPVAGTAGLSNVLCGSAAPTPAVASIKGQKYQSSPADWNVGDQFNGWRCLRFSMTDPQYYSYNYVSSGTTGAAGDTFNAIANGDLNGDGVISTFQLDGKIVDTAGVREVFVSPNMQEVLADE